jgi:hypothetical protein
MFSRTKHFADPGNHLEQVQQFGLAVTFDQDQSHEDGENVGGLECRDEDDEDGDDAFL